MKNTDFLKIILCLYGYDRNINVSSYRGDYGAVGYDVSAQNSEGDTYSEVCCEPFTFHVAMILKYMKENNVDLKSNWWGIGTKNLLDLDYRQSLLEKWDKHALENQMFAEQYKPIQEWKDKNNPCPNCTINKKDHWDSVHYNCELNHTSSCDLLKKYSEAHSKMTRELNESIRQKLENIEKK